MGDIGLSVRGFHGEGSEVVGNLFQVSNQVTLGRSEQETADDLEKVTKETIDMEEHAREVLLKKARAEIEDKVCRAVGILDNARLLTTQEFMNLSSAARLGISLGLVSRPTCSILNELMVLTQPSHLQHLAGEALDAQERDELRASMVRQRMAQHN
jgi:protein arginine kinase